MIFACFYHLGQHYYRTVQYSSLTLQHCKHSWLTLEWDMMQGELRALCFLSSLLVILSSRKMWGHFTVMPPPPLHPSAAVHFMEQGRRAPCSHGIFCVATRNYVSREDEMRGLVVAVCFLSCLVLAQQSLLTNGQWTTSVKIFLY